MNKKFHLSLLLAVSVLLSSCEKEENVPQTDYSIESTSGFELVSQHANGWIKEGHYQLAGGPTKEFEYYENGYIKSAKVYASYPQQHLVEVRIISRSGLNITSPMESYGLKPNILLMDFRRLKRCIARKARLFTAIPMVS